MSFENLGENVNIITSSDTKVTLKHTLEETDNENEYILVKGPIYIPKSVIKEKVSLIKTNSVDTSMVETIITIDSTIIGNRAENNCNESIHKSCQSSNKAVQPVIDRLISKIGNERNRISVKQYEEGKLGSCKTKCSQGKIKIPRSSNSTVEEAVSAHRVYGSRPLQQPRLDSTRENELKLVGSRPINELERCKNNCKLGNFSITKLLEACEKNPDSILNAYKTNQQSSYRESVSAANTPLEEYLNQSYISEITRTHGDKFGDPKYHYLMVDCSTSLTRPSQLEQIEPKEEIGPTVAIDTESAESVETEVIVDYTIVDRKRSIIKEPVIHKHVSEAYEASQADRRRVSTVSWGAIGPRGGSSARFSDVESLEQVLLEAAARAQSFRHNETKKHNLLGQIEKNENKKSSQIKDNRLRQDSTISQPVRQAPTKKFFGMMNHKKKSSAKPQSKRSTQKSQIWTTDEDDDNDNEEAGSTLSEESSEEMVDTDTETLNDSSEDNTSRNIYQSRASKHLENPVFQRDKD